MRRSLASRSHPRKFSVIWIVRLGFALCPFGYSYLSADMGMGVRPSVRIGIKYSATPLFCLMGLCFHLVNQVKPPLQLKPESQNRVANTDGIISASRREDRYQPRIHPFEKSRKPRQSGLSAIKLFPGVHTFFQRHLADKFP